MLSIVWWAQAVQEPRNQRERVALGKSWGLIAFTASECLVLWHGLTLCSAWPSPREGPASCYSVPSQESSSRRRAGFKDTVVNLGKSTWGVTQMLGAWGFALSPHPTFILSLPKNSP